MCSNYEYLPTDPVMHVGSNLSREEMVLGLKGLGGLRICRPGVTYSVV